MGHSGYGDFGVENGVLGMGFAHLGLSGHYKKNGL